MKRITRTVSILLVSILLISTMTIGVSAKGGTIRTHIGIVDASSLRLRSKPSTSSATLDTAPRGEIVVVSGKTGSWYKVTYDLTEGYMHESYLDLFTQKNVELGYGRVNANKVNIRSGPGTTYKAVDQANSGNKAYIIGFNNQWYKVIIGSQIGYIRSDYLDLTEIPYENQASTKTPKFFVDGQSTGVTPNAGALNGTTAAPTTLRQKIVATAKKYIGTPYVWGGTSSTGFDCSGFTQFVMKAAGVTIPRTTTEQYKIGSYVEKNALQPGDLVFLQNTYRAGISHVGIYIGDGKMIHASSSKGVTTSSLSSSYYVQHYYGARRVI